jgi:hypothetical protein
VLVRDNAAVDRWRETMGSVEDEAWGCGGIGGGCDPGGRPKKSTSSVSLARVPTEVVGASSTRRRGILAAVDVSKPPYTKQYVDDYRKRMKDDPDPEAQFAYAKYLIVS